MADLTSGSSANVPVRSLGKPVLLTGQSGIVYHVFSFSNVRIVAKQVNTLTSPVRNYFLGEFCIKVRNATFEQSKIYNRVQNKKFGDRSRYRKIGQAS